jgi:hypothetical protein
LFIFGNNLPLLSPPAFFTTITVEKKHHERRTNERWQEFPTGTGSFALVIVVVAEQFRMSRLKTMAKVVSLVIFL